MENKRLYHERRKIERRWMGGVKPEFEQRVGERRIGERRKSLKEDKGPPTFLNKGKKPLA